MARMEQPGQATARRRRCTKDMLTLGRPSSPGTIFPALEPRTIHPGSISPRKAYSYLTPSSS